MKHRLSGIRLVPAAVLFTMLLMGCAKHAKVYTVQKSVRSSDSTCTVEADYTLVHSDSYKVSALLEWYNNAIVKNLNDSIAKFKAEARQAKPYLPPGMTYELYITDSVFMATKDFVSLRYSVYTFTGGAHGMTQFYSYNYDIPAEKQLDKNQFFKPECTGKVNGLLEKHFRNPDGCFTEKPTLEAATAVNITPENVTFIYDQYILGAYACGPAEINVPASELKDCLAIKDFPVGTQKSPDVKN